MVYPWVLQVPQVSHDTVNLTVRFLPVPVPGMLGYGYGVQKPDPWVTHAEP